jgi:DNA-binding transcriptional regulator YiaG
MAIASQCPAAIALKSPCTKKANVTLLTLVDESSIYLLVTGKDFAKLRQSAGFTQAQLAREIDVTIRSLTRWETGETPIPKIAELALRYVIERKQKGTR